VTVTSLAELDPAAVDMRCLLLIGSSRTQLAEWASGDRVVYTPRRYPS
jgi:precorrin-2 C20-methyltransferase / precorrin-3B C17-methyltransferase